MDSEVRRRVVAGEPSHHDDHTDNGNQGLHGNQKHFLHDCHYLSLKEVFVTIPYFIILTWLIWCAHTHLPTPKSSNVDATIFSASRAREYLQGITGIGDHVVGSYENDVLTVKYLLNTIDKIRSSALPDYEIDVDVQTPSGGFILHFLFGPFTNTYNNVTNIVVHLYPKGAKPEHNIMVNAHFDSQVNTEGASDDAVSCALMLEIMSCISRSSPATMKHGVIFLFNGAEESLLEGGHGFVTQHKHVPSIRAFVNLEAAGSGGRELVFQTGPGHPWLIQTYAKSAVHPYASVVAQEVFQSGVIPSDTDFRIFRDFGNIPGIDIAYSSNGYVYHTKYDSADRIPNGSIQRAGENVLSVVKNLVASPYVEDTSKYKHGKVVFFDILGQMMIIYPWRMGIILNLSLVLVALLYIAKQVVLRDLIGRKGQEHVERGHATAFLVTGCFFATILSFIAGFMVSALLAVILTKLGKSMTWYSCPSFALLLYGLPFLTTAIAIHSGAKKLMPQCYKHASTIGHRQLERSCVYSHIILISCGLVYMTYKGWLSSYFLMLWLLFAIIGHCILYDQILYSKGLVWSSFNLILCHAIGHFVPAVLSAYNIYAVYDTFIPIFGRLGTEMSTDMAISFVSSFTVAILTLLMISLVYTLKTSRNIILVLALVSVVPFLMAALGGVFPYSGKDPVTPKRIIFQHMHRKYYNEQGNVTSEDSGVWIIPMDILGLSDLKNMPSLKSAEPMPCQGVYCGLPYYYPMRFMVRKTWFVPTSPPPIKNWPVLEVVKKEQVDDQHVRLHFSVIGPDHMNTYIGVKKDVELINWSLTKDEPAPQSDFNGGMAYFIFSAHGYYADPWRFWIDFMHPKSAVNASVADIAIAGQFVHGKESITDTLESILKEVPSWAVDSAWVSSYQQWTV